MWVILSESYDPLKADQGLSLDSFRVLESNLDAVSRTPRLHRDELLQFVHRPDLIELLYSPTGTQSKPSRSLQRLRAMHSLDIEQDPWIVRLREEPEVNAELLEKTLLSRKTWSHDQIRELTNKAAAVEGALGSRATDFYISQCVEKFNAGVGSVSLIVDPLEVAEKMYLQRQFQGLSGHIVMTDNEFEFSPKLNALMAFLSCEDHAGFSGRKPIFPHLQCLFFFYFQGHILRFFKNLSCKLDHI